jgi:hypothetical protein
MEFLRQFNRSRQPAAPVPTECDHTCLGEEDVRRICLEMLRDQVKVDWYGRRALEPARTTKLTWEDVEKMDRDEINRRWDEVELVLKRGPSRDRRR